MWRRDSARSKPEAPRGFLEVFNILNANPEQQINWSTDDFLQPLSIVSPRIARIGVKFRLVVSARV